MAEEGILRGARQQARASLGVVVVHSPVRLKGDLCAVGCSGSKSHGEAASQWEQAGVMRSWLL